MPGFCGQKSCLSHENRHTTKSAGSISTRAGSTVCRRPRRSASTTPSAPRMTAARAVRSFSPALPVTAATSSIAGIRTNCPSTCGSATASSFCRPAPTRPAMQRWNSMASHRFEPTASRTHHRSPRRVLILGAAGRDFHNFNTVYRADPAVRVVAFTATQIPGIAGRRYPAELAGALYPDGIPIRDEGELELICREERVEEVVFAYSDVPHEEVMHIASRALATGADFKLLGPDSTMLRSKCPVIAVTALRTGCGKQQIARWLSRYLRDRGKRVAVLRHPMPYGDLLAERVQRFATMGDLDRAGVTAEEREEYEPH